MNPARRPYLAGALLAFVGAFGFSAKAVWVRMAYLTAPIDPASLLTLRMLFSAPLYALVAWRLHCRPGNVPLPPRQWLQVGGVGVMGYYLASLFDFQGLQYITAATERLILFIYPTLVVLLGAVFFRKKITPVQVASLVLTYAGMAVAFSGGDAVARSAGAFWLGSGLVLLSALTYALYLIGSGRLIPQVGALKFTCWAMLFSAGATFLHSLAGNGFRLFHYPPKLYGLVALMAVFATFIPTFLVSEGIRRIGPDNAAVVASVGPVLTIALAWYSLGEAVTLAQLAGTVLVLAGVLLISLAGKSQSPA